MANLDMRGIKEVILQTEDLPELRDCNLDDEQSRKSLHWLTTEISRLVNDFDTLSMAKAINSKMVVDITKQCLMAFQVLSVKCDHVMEIVMEDVMLVASPDHDRMISALENVKRTSFHVSELVDRKWENSTFSAKQRMAEIRSRVDMPGEQSAIIPPTDYEKLYQLKENGKIAAGYQLCLNYEILADQETTWAMSGGLARHLIEDVNQYISQYKYHGTNKTLPSPVRLVPSIQYHGYVIGLWERGGDEYRIAENDYWSSGNIASSLVDFLMDRQSKVWSSKAPDHREFIDRMKLAFIEIVTEKTVEKLKKGAVGGEKGIHMTV